MGWIAITVISVLFGVVLLNDLLKLIVYVYFKRKETMKRSTQKIEPFTIITSDIENRKKMFKEIRRLDSKIANALRSRLK